MRSWVGKGIVLGGAIVLFAIALSAVLFRQRERVASPALDLRVRYLDVHGEEVRDGSHSLGRGSSSADLLLDVSVRRAGAADRAVLFLFDGEGRSLRERIALEPHGGALRAVLSVRELGGRTARRGLLLVGPAGDLERASALGGHSKLLQRQLDIRVPGMMSRFEPSVLDEAERRLRVGDYAAALASIDALGDTVPEAIAPRAAAVAAEAAFAYGRTALARRLAEAALAARATSASAELPARLRRVQILAIAEGSESTEPPPERERLQESVKDRPDPLERVLDAAVDLHLAWLHDRFSRGAPRAESRARLLLELAASVEPQSRLSGAAASLCRAGKFVARRDHAEGLRAVRAASALARESGNHAALATCWIAEGDLFYAREEWVRAAAAFDEAIEALEDRDLPRLQREAWFSAAKVAERRGDRPAAFERSKRATRWVDRLLALEVDMAAREQLLVNTLGYFGAAQRFGALAGNPVAAIAVAESGKANALVALMQGSSRIDGSTLWPAAARARAAMDDDYTAETTRLSRAVGALGPRDVAISYMLLGMNAERRFEIAIGVLTRDGVTVTLVEQPDTFLDDVVALADAVEQNREDRAKIIGMRLHATLIAPVAERLAGKDRLFVSPHLRLHTLPWNALHDGTRFLVHRFAIARSLPFLVRDSARDESRPFDHGSRPRWILAANPRHAELESLPGFAGIVREFAARLPVATTLSSSEATSERLAAELRRADVMLFAGHAIYDAQMPLKSALLTAAPRASEARALWRTDRLEARALLRLEQRLDLVILLGCETARLWRGKSSYSDEAIGLGRAFLIAGARHVIGALWPVLDRDAEDLLRAILATGRGDDVVTHVQEAARCLAQARCPNRGIASWASFVVESR